MVSTLAASTRMDPQAVKLMWFSVARQTRPMDVKACPYVGLAKKHHDVEVKVVDLGQYSAEHSNSCMFLSCAASIADRRLQGFADAELPGVLGDGFSSVWSFSQEVSIEELVEDHARSRMSTLGRMADALRHAACEVLVHDEDFYFPFFHSAGAIHAEQSREDFRKWVGKLRGDEEGDELVLLALARLCGVAIQPVQASGYRVPIMDPTGSAESGAIFYWGNDNKHWVWLRIMDK